MTSENTCMMCREKFTQNDTGTMRCYVHPALYAKDVYGFKDSDYYSCCGASVDRYHELGERSWPSGCHRIDHVSNMKELDAILGTPYICKPLSEAHSLVVYKNAKLLPRVNQNWIEVKNYNYFEYKLSFKTFNGRVIEIDPLEEHSRICDRPSFTLSDSSTIPYANYYIYEEEDLKATQFEKLGEEAFTPFCIIRRMDCAPDKHKLAEIHNFSMSLKE